VPIVYRLDAPGGTALTLDMDDGSQMNLEEPVLTADLSAEIFMRSGRVRRIELVLETRQLFTNHTDVSATASRDGR